MTSSGDALPSFCRKPDLDFSEIEDKVIGFSVEFEGEPANGRAYTRPLKIHNVIPCFDRENVSYEDVYDALIKRSERWIGHDGWGEIYYSKTKRPLSEGNLDDAYRKHAELNAARLIKENYIDNK